MPKLIIRLPSRQRLLLTGVFSALWLSGALWLTFHYFLATEGDFGPRPHWLEGWWLRLHGLMAMAALVTLGSLIPVHMALAWEKGCNRRSGLMMLALCAWLAATGYALWYFASEANETWLPLLHWGAGLGLPLILALHIAMRRRRGGFKLFPWSRLDPAAVTVARACRNESLE